MSSRLVTRRRALLTGLAAISGLAVTRDWSDMPPTYGNILRMGDDLTYAAFRMLPRQRLVREYTLADISSFPAHGVIDLGAANAPQIVRDYRRLLDGRFADWRLSVEGRVATPRAFSLNELKQLPSRAQITRHVCEEGWSAIAQWTGVPLRTVLERAGILPTARSDVQVESEPRQLPLCAILPRQILSVAIVTLVDGTARVMPTALTLTRR